MPESGLHDRLVRMLGPDNSAYVDGHGDIVLTRWNGTDLVYPVALSLPAGTLSRTVDQYRQDAATLWPDRDPVDAVLGSARCPY